MHGVVIHTHTARTTDSRTSTTLVLIHKHTAGAREKNRLNTFITYSAVNITQYNTACRPVTQYNTVHAWCCDTIQHSAQTSGDTYTVHKKTRLM